MHALTHTCTYAHSDQLSHTHTQCAAKPVLVETCCSLPVLAGGSDLSGADRRGRPAPESCKMQKNREVERGNTHTHIILRHTLVNAQHTPKLPHLYPHSQGESLRSVEMHSSWYVQPVVKYFRLQLTEVCPSKVDHFLSLHC